MRKGGPAVLRVLRDSSSKMDVPPIKCFPPKMFFKKEKKNGLVFFLVRTLRRWFFRSNLFFFFLFRFPSFI